MNKIVASVGLVALGASSVQAVHAQGMAAPESKPWSISATLRGFYDDNVSTVPDGPLKHSVWGFQISPSANLNWKSDQTSVVLGYVYSLKYYDHKPVNASARTEMTHTFNAGVKHSFSERMNLSAGDSFVIGQEPDILRSGNTFSTFQRTSGNNIRNYGTIEFNAQLTRLFGVDVGYGNSYYDYSDKGFTTVPSLSARLDRVEHKVHVDGTWLALPQTTALLGYQYGQTDYTGNEPIDPFGSGLLVSKDRNNRSHSGYVGVDQTFNPRLSGHLRVGVTDTSYYNDPNGSSDKVSPYVRASIRYDYAVESFGELGFTYDRNATDLIGVNTTTGTFALDEESAVLYGSITHRIIPNLYASVTGQFQDSTIHGGALDNMNERFYLLGLNVKYQFNHYLAAEVGYDYDKLDSEVAGRSFDRNRAYVGVTATY
jgi:hypothetical protein